MGTPEPEVMNLIARHFPSCVAMESDVKWKDDTQLMVTVHLFFPPADPSVIDEDTCHAFCNEMQAGVRSILHRSLDATWAESVAIRTMLVFHETGRVVPNAQDRRN